MTSRREFIEQASLAAIGLSVPLERPSVSSTPAPRGFIDILRAPDFVLAQTAAADQRLTKSSGDRFTAADITVTTLAKDGALHVQLAAPRTAVKRIQLRWRGDISNVQSILGDAWERGYGDLEWRSWVPDRVMPWYAATFDGTLTHAYGVRTGASAKAMCFWQIDSAGISLFADVRAGGVGVQLGERTLDVCDAVCRAGKPGETSFAAIHAFCKQMCESPRLPPMPVYGSNDWYWAYGKNSAQTVLTDTKNIVALSPTGLNRPFAVIDDGWQPQRGADRQGVGTWDHGNEKFGDMAALAANIKQIGARPGVWIRPLQATAATPDSWRSPRDRMFVDPTIAEVKEKISADVSRLTQWGYELIKHDYTTFDIFGRWGSTMGSALTRDGWTFAAGATRTTAEVIWELYRVIRAAAGDCLIIGCNTMSHLSAGHFEICRVGDDTSGTEWARTRKMGVNSLAFRGPQHGAFYVADADCVGVTNAVPWSLNRQWLDLLARSGTMLFVSLAPDALGADQKRDLKDALALAAVSHPLAEPLDWLRSAYPSKWRAMGRDVNYDWVGPDGAGPG